MKISIGAFLTLLVLLGCTTGICLYKTFWETSSGSQIPYEYQIKPIVENNSEIMSEMAYVFENLIENTSIMMRYSHYLDKHNPSVKIVPLCPECTKAEDELLPLERGRQEELPSTFDQITQDSYEMKMTVQRIKNSLHNQKIKLQHTLNQLRAMEND
jgi:hypothetical protein